MNIHFIKTPEKRDIIKELNENFEITDVPFLLIESGKEKIRAFSGHLSKDEISKIGEIANIELIGLYFMKRESYLRLSLDATHFLSNQINKNIFELSEFQFSEWIRGRDLAVNLSQGIYVIKYKDDFLGCGKSNGSTLFNHIPKDRRLKK